MKTINSRSTKLKPIQGDIDHLTVKELWGKITKIAEDCQERICSEDETLDEPKCLWDYCYPTISYMGIDYMTITFRLVDHAPLLAISELIENMFTTFNCWGGLCQPCCASHEGKVHACERNTLDFHISVNA